MKPGVWSSLPALLLDRILANIGQKIASGKLLWDVRYVSSNGGYDTLRLFLREAGKYPLLTRKDEVRLSRLKDAGDEAARQTMILANVRLVVRIANDYAYLGMPLEDLISEGLIGLMRGVERYKPDKGAKLSSYTAWWIKQAIRRALSNKCTDVRVPVWLRDRKANIQKAAVQLEYKLGRQATEQEIGEQLGLSAEKVNDSRSVCTSIVSLDAPIGNDETSEVGELVSDDARAPDQCVSEEDMLESLDEIMKNGVLDARLKEILIRRFGLADGERETLSEIAQTFGVSRERIRQLERQGIRKIRTAMKAKDNVVVNACRLDKPKPALQPRKHKYPPPIDYAEMRAIADRAVERGQMSRTGLIIRFE